MSVFILTGRSTSCFRSSHISVREKVLESDLQIFVLIGNLRPSFQFVQSVAAGGIRKAFVELQTLWQSVPAVQAYAGCNAMFQGVPDNAREHIDMYMASP